MWIERVLSWYSLDGLARNSAVELELGLLRKGMRCLHSPMSILIHDNKIKKY